MLKMYNTILFSNDDLIALSIFKIMLMGVSKSTSVHDFPHLHAYVHYFLNTAHNLLMGMNYHMELNIILSN